MYLAIAYLSFILDFTYKGMYHCVQYCNLYLTYTEIYASHIFNNDLMIRDRNFFMSSSEQRVYIYKFTHMSSTYEMKFFNPCREEAFTMQQKIYTFTNISLFFEVLFMIPCSGQYIYIYRFTHMSHTL